ncbi:MAG: hydroxysqualene dehydroxylase, partial [Solirubrobacteraceae bacterium]
MARTVAVLGGGVGGLSAAHELAERGLHVSVYESRERFGGKARSFPVPGSGEGDRPELPAEHGFRFFPGFYRHLPDTMRRIPVGGQADGVAGNLVTATRALMAQAGGRNELVGVTRQTGSREDVRALNRFLKDWSEQIGIPAADQAFFFERLLTLLTSCDERRYEQWENQSWWEFSDAEQRSAPYGKFLADGLTRTLVAARAREMSARTGGFILLQLLFDLAKLGGAADRVLNAPTSEAWIDPWVEYLRSLGVALHADAPVTGIGFDGRRITGVTAGAERVRADHYIAALPVEQLRLLLTPELRQADPALARLDRLVTRWMNGMMFYLDRDVQLVHGHAIYIDSAWALTSISQAQFWDGIDLADYGDGRVEGILSVDVSEWERPGRRTGKVASKCTPQEIHEEVWGQLQDHLNDGDETLLDDANMLRSFLDPAIQFPNPTGATNLEPLLVNTAGSWADRPEARTRIPNLLLASDFVRTFTDLATMEGANEAARRAVNEILDTTGSGAERCEVWKLREPAIFAPARALDRVRWRLLGGRRAPRPPLRVDAHGEL